MGAEVIGMWGTWEELLLGGAVLRHGTRDWKLVASELRARTVCPYTFTPEVCKARYEDLRQRFRGCKAWFEELRKQRMAELRQALELSENSIGSLELKLETLKATRGDDSHVDYYSSQTESPVPFQKSEAGFVFSSKETSKDGLSAGSFTRETVTNWSPESQNPSAVVLPAEEMDDAKPEEDSRSSEQYKVLSIAKLTEIVCGQGGSLRRRRSGTRKRKYCIISRDVKEENVGESEFLGVANTATVSPRCKENSTGESGQIPQSCGVDDQSGSSRKNEVDDIMGVFESVAQNDSAFVFRHRLDSQKRGRYKKMILRHMDFDTIRSRISNHSIKSVKELFRDLLLLANNAVVFYSKNTREYKSALRLRALVTKTLKQHIKDFGNKPIISAPYSSLPMHKPPVKPRSARPGNRRPPGKVASNVDKNLSRGIKPSQADSPPGKVVCNVDKNPSRGIKPSQADSPPGKVVCNVDKNPSRGIKPSQADSPPGKVVCNVDKNPSRGIKPSQADSPPGKVVCNVDKNPSRGIKPSQADSPPGKVVCNVDKNPSRGSKPSKADSPPSVESFALTKKSFDGPRKVGRADTRQRSENAGRGRKRTRVR